MQVRKLKYYNSMQLRELQGQIYEVLKGMSIKHNNYHQLNSLIQKVFAFPELLNLSFREYHNKVADQINHNTDIKSLENFYNDMAKNETGFHNGFQSVLQLFFKAMSSSIDVDNFVKNAPTCYSNMRFLLILIFCPSIYDESSRSNYIKMTNLLSSLKSNQKQCLSYWLTSMSISKLQWIVKYTQKAISNEVMKLLPENMDKNDVKSTAHFIQFFCSFLSILNRSNDIKSRLSIQSFRNLDIMKYFGHNDQYLLYKKKTPILNFIQYPFLLDIHYKLKLLEIQNKDEQQTKMEEGMLNLLQAQIFQNQPIQLNTEAFKSLYLQVKVHRNNILLDSMNQLMHAKGLKNPMKVTFIDQLGDDGGGVKKQYFQLLIKELFDPNRYMFVTKNQNRYHWFNVMSFQDSTMYEFAGVVVGLSIYNGTMLDLKFPRLVYKLLLRKDGEAIDHLQQLRQIQPDMYKSFKYILQTTEPLQSMQLHFTAEVMQFDQKLLVPLKSKGEYIRVSQSNKQEYVQLYSKYLIQTQTLSQFNAFKKGFFKVVTGNMIKLFNPEELERIICGLQVIDLRELKKAAKYDGGYHQYSYIVRSLWEILDELDLNKKKAFLFFTTGSDRAPIGGLSTLKFTIQRHGPDTQNVPTSHTCSNVLLLPQYNSKDKLRKKLLIALNHNQGFGLI